MSDVFKRKHSRLKIHTALATVYLSAAFSLSVIPAQAQGVQINRNLPPCRMDSFVDQAGGMAELIYGDEGVGAELPPFDNFTKEHRINAGIFGIRDEGLTTGHGSLMPDAWGADEYIGNEWGQSGAQHYDAIYNGLYYNAINQQP